MNPNEYVRVYQTWELVSKITTRDAFTKSEVKDESVQDTRHLIQMARVDKGMSIQDLAFQVNCDPQTLSSFERGDDVVSEEVYLRVKNVLDLGSKRQRRE